MSQETHSSGYPTAPRFDVIVHLELDMEATPFDADCYSAADIDAWRRDEWWYVGIVVTVSRDDVPVGEASIWAVENGTLPGGIVCDPFASEYVPDLISEAIETARVTRETAG